MNAKDKEEPTPLNSNLLPVKAKGEVLFLSVWSFLKSGMTLTPVLKRTLLSFLTCLFEITDSITSFISFS